MPRKKPDGLERIERKEEEIVCAMGMPFAAFSMMALRLLVTALPHRVLDWLDNLPVDYGDDRACKSSGGGCADNVDAEPRAQPVCIPFGCGGWWFWLGCWC